MTVPLDFAQQGDFKWWEIIEITGSTNPAETMIACCSSKDN